MLYGRMAQTIKFTHIASNDPSGGFYEFVSSDLGKAVASLRPSSMTRDDYHVSIMEEFIAAVKARKVSQEIAYTVQSAVFKEHMLARLTISPNDGQTPEELEASLQQKSKARLTSIIQAACNYHLEAVSTAKALELSQPCTKNTFLTKITAALRLPTLRNVSRKRKTSLKVQN